jgi:hypothetical protein
MVILCVVLRITPHPPNFAPVGATSVIAGRTMPPWLALVTVFVAMFIGDVILARLHGYPVVSAVTPFIYGGFAVQALLGRALRKRRGGAIGAALLGSCAFFILSNFGVWAMGDFYPSSATGLYECYVAAIPFFGATLVSDLLWTVALSLAYRAIAKRIEHRRSWVLVPSDQVAAF